MITNLFKKYRYIIFLFVGWRVFLLLSGTLAPLLFPLQNNFLGGGKQIYQTAPLFWSWLNFDGEHYLSLATIGYQPLTYFYFPFYPLLVGYVGRLIGGGVINTAIAGLLISNISFFGALVGLYKLLRLDYDDKLVKYTLLLITVFPTSFYFAAFYTESIFLLTCVWSFYFIRTNGRLRSSVLGAISAVTRIIGIALFPAFIVETLIQTKKPLNKLKLSRDLVLKLFWIVLIPLSLCLYMFFLYKQTGDPLEFHNSVGIFGDQRSSTFILLPQVFYRYIFKIIPVVGFQYLPTVFVTYFELLVGLSFMFLCIYSLFKLRLSYSIFLIIGYILPTLSGSFSSLPRYVIVLFPAFISLALATYKFGRLSKIIVVLLNLLVLSIAHMLFVEGYWVA